MKSSADRVRLFRQRQAAGKVPLRIECDETELIETLIAARLLDRNANADPSRAELEHAVERLLKTLAVTTFQ